MTFKQFPIHLWKSIKHLLQVVVGSEDLAANHDVMQIVEVQILNTCEAYVTIKCLFY